MATVCSVHVSWQALKVIGNYQTCYPLVADGEFCWHSDVCSSMSCNYNFQCDPMAVAAGFEAKCSANTAYMYVRLERPLTSGLAHRACFVGSIARLRRAVCGARCLSVKRRVALPVARSGQRGTLCVTGVCSARIHWCP